MELTKKRAKELSILKWQKIIDCFDKKKPKIFTDREEWIIETIEELKELNAGCAYCELYYKKNCSGCPIYKDFISCLSHLHPYQIYSSKPTRKNAQKMLDLIKKS